MLESCCFLSLLLWRERRGEGGIEKHREKAIESFNLYLFSSFFKCLYRRAACEALEITGCFTKQERSAQPRSVATAWQRQLL